MPDSVRELVVNLSLKAGNFAQTAADIKKQIQGVESEFSALGGKVGGFESTLAGRNAKISELTGKLKLEEQAVQNYSGQLKSAQQALAGASEAGQLAAARKVASVESNLNNALGAVQKTKAELMALEAQANAMRFKQFGSTMTGLGRSLQTFGRQATMYVTAPLAALGGKAYSLASEYETSFTLLGTKVEATDEQMAALNAEIMAMTETIPLSYTEMTDLMTVIAAAGVPYENLAEATKIMAGLGTTTNVAAETSAASMIKFLNVLGEGYSSMGNMASTLIELDNSTVAMTEDIFAMATRMAATGGLTGMSADQILGLAAAFSSMGIEAEAGGTAASKLMKRMQLAAETGEKIEDFTYVMGLSTEDFISGWNANPAQSMLNFFQGLANIDASGESSVVAMLDDMGLKEVRLSNLIAVAASNPEMFSQVLGIAADAWKENGALAEKTGEIYSTQASQNAMAMNTMENAAADVGENVQDAFQPILDKVTEVMKKFGELDEDTQTRIVSIAGTLMLLGPAASLIGGLAKSIGNISTGIGKIIESSPTWGPKLAAFFASPAAWGIGAGVGVFALLTAIESIPSTVDIITANLKNIEIGINEDSYDTTMQALATLKAQSDALAGEKGEYNKNVSAAVKAGYGTDDMYGTAIGYEAMLTTQNISDIAGKYAAKYDELNGAIGAEKDKAKQAALAAERDTLKATWDAEVATAKANYMEQINALVSGMMANQPEAKAALEQASKDYDLLALLNTALLGEAGGNEADPIWKTIFTQDVLDRFFGGQQFENIVPNNLALTLEEKLMKGLEANLKSIGGKDSLAFTFLQDILGDPLTADLFDQTKTTGILDGLIEILDWKSAGEKSGANYGESLTPGLSDAITGAATAGLNAMAALGSELENEAARQGALAAAAYAAAFNSGMGGGSGNTGRTGGTSQGSGASFSATSNLNGPITIKSGADARTLARMLANENARQLRGMGVRS